MLVVQLVLKILHRLSIIESIFWCKRPGSQMLGFLVPKAIQLRAFVGARSHGVAAPRNGKLISQHSQSRRRLTHSGGTGVLSLGSSDQAGTPSYLDLPKPQSDRRSGS